MEYEPTSTLATILCCECGVPILPNPNNLCVDCLRSKIDISDAIPKQGNIMQCKKCERYLSPPNTWINAALESRELLAICLKKLKGYLQDVRLIDASFIWTEPHSKRIKVKVIVQKEVANGAFLEQTFVVEYVVHNQMCMDCHRVEAKDFWNSSVQVRQKVSHKKTFYYLEQIILKHKMHLNVSKISDRPNGLDFFYASKQEARKFTDFLCHVLPCKYQASQKLVSHDTHSNTYNYKTSYSVELPPICKNDIVCLTPKMAQQMGNLGQILICLRVTNNIHLIDPCTLQIAEVDGNSFWRSQFSAICLQNSYCLFVVMDFDIPHVRPHKSGEGGVSTRHVLADVWLIKASELGMHENYIHTKTHLGHLLNIGDTIMGLDVANSNINNKNFEKMKDAKIPEVILVNKVFGSRQSRKSRRKWKLQRLAGDKAGQEDNYLEFLEDIEEDQDFRKNVDIYAAGDQTAEDATNDIDFPSVALSEMIKDLSINDVEMGDDD